MLGHGRSEEVFCQVIVVELLLVFALPNPENGLETGCTTLSYLLHDFKGDVFWLGCSSILLSIVEIFPFLTRKEVISDHGT